MILYTLPLLVLISSRLRGHSWRESIAAACTAGVVLLMLLAASIILLAAQGITI